MGEYGYRLPEAMEFPLEAYLALLPAVISRHGGKANGPDYIDQAAIAARENCWAWLRARFTILEKGVPGPANALAKYLAAKPK